MKKCALLLVCGLFLMCSRSQKEAADDDFFKIELGSLLKKGEAENITLDKWGKNIQFIPLETNDSILIKNINKIIQKDDKLLIMHEKRASVFDLEGKYLYDIGKLGNGPDEYTSLTYLTVRHDTIFIKERHNRMKLYNWHGQFLGQFSTPELPILDFYPIPNTDAFLGHVPNRSGKSENRFVIFRDTTVLKLVPNLSRFEIVTENLRITIPKEMRSFDGTVPAFKELFNDTIFQIHPDYSLHPYAVVDLGDYKANEGYRFTITPAIATQKDFDVFNDKIALIVIGEKDDIIYMTPYNIGKKPYTFSFNKKSGETCYQKIIYPDNQYDLIEGSIFIPSSISADGKYLIDFEYTNNEDNPVVVLVDR